MIDTGFLRPFGPGRPRRAARGYKNRRALRALRGGAGLAGGRFAMRGEGCAVPAALAFLQKYRRALCCCGIVLAMLCVLFGVWLVEVRPCESKSLAARLNDAYETASPPIETSAEQEFCTDEPLTGLAFVFYLSGGQPAGDLALELYDADTGQLLSASTGQMANLLEGQYIGLGLDAPVPAGAAERYRLVLTPHYQTQARLALGLSASPLAAWGGAPLVADGAPQAGSLAILASTRAIGRFVSLFYWAVGLLLTALVAAAYWLISARRLALHQLYALLCAGLGLVFCLVLPPYAAPDEEFHINQAFSVASRIGSYLDFDGWHLSHVSLGNSFRRPGDVNPAVQDQKTTVFTWQAVSQDLFTLSPDRFGEYVEHEGELQADISNELYLASGLGVLLGFVLHLGFVPTLFLGRLANLAVFTLLTALAVKKAPFAKPVFIAAGLLPMTLHLAASYSRDSLLLALSFLYTALCLDAAFGPYRQLSRKQLAGTAAVGLLLAPAKSVYLPLCALALLIPAARLGARPRAKQAAFLAGCVLVFALSGARYQIAGFLSAALPGGASPAALSQQADAPDAAGGAPDTAGPDAGENEPDAAPDVAGGDTGENEPAAPNAAGQDAGEAAPLTTGPAEQSQPDPDTVCFSASYILEHPGLTVQLLARSAVQRADHYLKTLVGGNLSYYSLEIAWGWVVCCYLLLAFACRAPGALPDAPNTGAALHGRLLAGALALCCCGLAVLGCVSWTPTYYQTIYGLQGRYFLPVLPAALLALCPADVWSGQTAASPGAARQAGRLLLGFAAVNAGVLVNAMLAVMAR